MKKPRPHEFCHECGSDLGEIPPPPPRCRRCLRPVKGHEGPWGLRRCKVKKETIKMEQFFKATMKDYGAALDRMMYAEHPLVGTFAKVKQ